VETWSFGEPVTSVVLTNDEQLIVLVLGSRIVVWDTRAHKIVRELYRLPEWPYVRCNDARVDPAGVLWFGTMQNNVHDDGTTGSVTERRGALFSLAADFQAKKWHDGFGISNTVAWSPDGATMYFGDTLENTLYRGSFDPVNSRLEGREVFFTGFGRGLPDGSAVDAEGCLWNCRYDGSCVVRVAPDGSIAGVLETPVKNPTTCAFGGDDLSTLFFTAAESADEQPQTLAGSLFCLRVPVRGLPVTGLRL
jgi:sugar lactone lactonase YvrE